MLLCLFFLLFTTKLEIPKLIGRGAGGNNVQVVAESLLLEELLGQVLQISLGEGKLSSNIELGLISGDSNLGAKVALQIQEEEDAMKNI